MKFGILWSVCDVDKICGTLRALSSHRALKGGVGVGRDLLVIVQRLGLDEHHVDGNSDYPGLLRLLSDFSLYSEPLTQTAFELDTFCSGKSVQIQSTLVISTSLISNNRLYRSEILVPVLTWKSKHR